MHIHFLFFALLALASSCFGQESKRGDRWGAWEFLLGEWVGEGSGDPGQGSGGFTLYLDIQSTILVRRNFANYPATKDRPAFSHEDLMVIYYENDRPQAMYFDNENHVIRYRVEFSKDSSAVTFLSEQVPSAPRFRFTYTKAPNEALRIAFDIAPPDKPDTFSRYVEAVARRKK
jgi:hypothetical protein